MAKSTARQSIGGEKNIAHRQIAGRFGQVDQGSTYALPVGTYAWSPPKAGYWKIVLHGPGGQSLRTSGWGGGSGAYLEKTVFLNPAQSLAVVVGACGTDTTVTLPSGAVLRAGSGAANVAGVASGGDLNTNGATAGTNIGGNAPGSAQFPGGLGGPAFGAGPNAVAAGAPGGGGGTNTFSGYDCNGADGQAVFMFVRP